MSVRTIVTGAIVMAVAGCGSDVDVQRENVGAARSALSWYATAVTNMNPVAWYRFEETSGPFLIDSTGNHHGLYTSAQPDVSDGAAMYGVDSAVADVGTHAVHFGARTASGSGVYGTPSPATDAYGNYRGQYAEVPDHDDFSITKGWDTFARTYGYASDWGNPTHGNSSGNWTPVNSAALVYGTYAPSAVSYINETLAVGQFGQKFPAKSRADSDAEVYVRWFGLSGGVWGQPAKTTVGSFYPVTLASRFTDSNNYYGARVQELNGVLTLSIVKRSGGTTTVLAGPVAAPYSWPSPGYNMQYLKVRLKVETDRSAGTAGSAQIHAYALDYSTYGSTPFPVFQLNATDATPLGAGTSAVLSSNFGSNNSSLVHFSGFRLQAPLTVSAWIRPSQENFTGNPGLMCPTGFVPQNYVHFLNKHKQQTPMEYEWVFRHYPGTAYDPSCGDNRQWAVSTYAFALAPTSAANHPNNQGAGVRKNPGAPLNSSWHHVLALYDSGDATDRDAGITQYFDGARVGGPKTDGTCNEANYCHPVYWIIPGNGSAPLRIGYSTDSGFTQFQGDIDEVSFYEYKWSATDASNMWALRN